MRGRYLLGPKDSHQEGNIYANKSSLVVEWLLCQGIRQSSFSLREVARDTGVSVGLAQRVFQVLVFNGIMRTEGLRTAKRFVLHKPNQLLREWISYYNITKKCRLWNYTTGLGGRNEIIEALHKLPERQQVALALHAASDMHGYMHTNLHTVELYIMDQRVVSDLTRLLALEPRERGYDVLLIDPYYKALVKRDMNVGCLTVTNPLLTFLDLYHFPLRGREQAEYLAEHIPELSKIYRPI